MTTLSDLILEGSRPPGVQAIPRPVQTPANPIADAFNQFDQQAGRGNFFDQFDAPPQQQPANFFDQFDTPPAPELSTAAKAGDVVKSGGVGLVKGGIGLAGLPGDLNNLAGSGLEALGDDGSMANAIGRAMKILNPFAGSHKIQKTIEDNATGKFYEPQTTAGEYAQTAGEFLGPSVIGKGHAVKEVVKRMVTQGVAPAAVSETAGQVAREVAPEAEGAARLVSAVLTPAAMAAGRKAITPNTVSPQRLQAAEALKNEGVEVTAGQVAGKDKLKYKEAMAGNETNEQQLRQLTEAAVKRIGETGDNVFEAVQRARPKIGAQFDNSTKRMDVIMDKKLGNDLQRVSADMLKEGLDPNQVRRIEAQLQNIQAGFTTVANGQRAARTVMPGAVFHTTVKTGGPLMRVVESSDATLAHYGDRIRNVIFDAAERTAHRRGTRANTGARQAFEDFQEARRLWANMKALEHASSTGAAGGVSAAGILTPAAVRRAATYRDATKYARGIGDFNDLARNSNMLMAPLPNSGTAQRVFARGSGRNLGAAVGALVGSGAMPALGPVAGTVIGGVLGQKLQGAIVMSKAGQRYFRNQALPAPVRGTTVRRTVVTIPAATARERRNEEY